MNLVDFPRSAALADLHIVEETASTNDDLLAIAATSAEFTVIATGSQTAGRGRLGRVWIAPPGQTLAASVLLKPRLPSGETVPVDGFGWLPLLAGLAMTRSVAAALGDTSLAPTSSGPADGSERPADSERPAVSVRLKWPNDVLVNGKKVSGLLAELLPALDGVIIGSGVNLSIPADNLPTPVSTSLGLHLPAAADAVPGDTADATDTAVPGDPTLADAVLAGYLGQLRALYERYLAGGAGAVGSGLLAEVSAACGSIGQPVRVELPGGSALHGVAVGLDASGRLLVKRSTDDVVQAVAAGDVTHLRYE
jgi:BirA family biotin operon repressor/biotin-[acetyl-CoA-carboxylase] ligase